MRHSTGSLAERSSTELLMDAHRAARSGMIRLIRKTEEKAIFIKDGLILRAESNNEKEKLGQMLIKRNLISPWDLELALSQVKDKHSRLGQILLEMSALKESVLISTLVSQTRDIIFSTIDWGEGDFAIEEFNFSNGETPFDQLYTPEIILQAIRRIGNVTILMRSLGDLRGTVELAPDYLDRIRKVTLVTDEKKMLPLLRNPITLKRLSETSGIEKVMLFRSVAALLAVGVLIQHPAAPTSTKETGGNGHDPQPLTPEDSSPILTRSKTRKQLGEMLVEQKIITEEQLKEALKMQTTTKGKRTHLGMTLVQLGYATEEAIRNCLSEQLNIRKVDLIDFTEEAVKLIPLHLAKKYMVCPVRKQGTGLEVAVLDPTNVTALDDLSFVTGFKIKPVLTTNDALREAWGKAYGIKEEKGLQQVEKKEEPAKRGDLSYRDFTKQDEEDDPIASIGQEESPDNPFHFDVSEIETLVSGVVGDMQVVSEMDPITTMDQLNLQDAPIVKLVDTIMRQAINTGASDIHIEPWENKLQVRFRLDGTMHKVMSFPVTIANSLISRIKILARMDIAERRRPQDGRVKMKLGKKRTVDYRVSAVPTVYGERIVMRVLDRASLQIDMTKLGFDGKQLETFKKAICAPYGMILCTGPTGSGKTTTLYSALASLDHSSLNILTSEDPVEYNFPGISQVQVNDQINVTFANILRSFLRQDPDVIMVGEIRDSETAEICSKAALTGHLVLSTVHTNDAPSAIGRLIDLGLKPYLVSACLNMVIAQRLLRKICSQCRVEITMDRKILIDSGMTESQAETVLLYGGRGCDACGRTGYFGRIGIYEIMPVTRRIKSAIAADLPADQIKDIAISEGMKDLRRAALEKVFSGVTTLEEALQNTMVE